MWPPTDAQRDGWRAIRSGAHTLIAAPTGSGKTLAAFLTAIDELLREGLARVLPQALIAGKPVVSYDIDGAREVVVNDQTGMLLPPQSVDELAAAIGRLAGDPALRERLGATGRQRFTDVFRHEHMSRQLRLLYERVLAGPRAR